jgi:hypothetical protein
MSNNDAGNTVDAFFGQFGELDPHKLVVLKILFEEIYGQRKGLRLPSQERQEGSQDSQHNEGIGPADSNNNG